MVPISDRRSSPALIVILQRFVQSVITAWAAVSFTFFALRGSSGDPAAVLLSRGLVRAEDVAALRQELGFDQPLLRQYGTFLQDLLHGNLGQSLYTRQPVLDIILEQLPYTLTLAALALLFTLLLSALLGVGSAWWKGKPAAEILSGLSAAAIALPVMFVATLMLWVFRAGTVSGFLPQAQWVMQLFLPALVLGFSTAGGIAWLLQTGIIENMNAPFYLAAKARGVRPGFPLLWHAVKPALPPAVSLFALEASFLFTGTVVTETIFARPGVGRLLVQSILDGDFPVAQGLVVLAALVYTVSLAAGDVLGYILDPRLRGRS